MDQDTMDQDILNFIINHVFLPPKLPHKEDEEVQWKNAQLLLLIKSSAIRYREQLERPDERWDTAIKMLDNLYNIQGLHSISKKHLINAIQGMRMGDMITLHVAAQNAGIILQHLGSEILFTSFEASAINEAVMEAPRRLLISYPGPAISVPVSKIQDPRFCDEFAYFANKMDEDIIESAIPVSQKAGEDVSEIRNTANPEFITQMFTGILLGIGRPAEVNRFQKRIADDVLWDNVKLPWRRSPFWLVVRVAMQIALKEREHFKAFMVYFLADILDLALKSGKVNSDLLFIMNTKLGRRAYKLRDNIPPFVLAKASEITSKNQQGLQKIWAQIQEFHSEASLWKPGSLSFEEDARLSLKNSREYLKDVMSRKMDSPQPLPFDATHPKREPKSTREFSSAPADELLILLADFENWVQESLNDWTDNWLQPSIYREGAIQELSGWINDYTAAAKKEYKSNPESMSIMFLTAYELWVALDKIAVTLYPLLSEYTPGFSKELFEPLLLPRYQQMERLQSIELYIEQRRSKAKYPSILSDFSSPNEESFAVRYFKESQHHKRLEETILADAQEEKEMKSIEHKEMMQRHAALMARHRSNSCNYYASHSTRWNWHKSGCPRCGPESEAGRMSINRYEWPLPKNKLNRMAVVFELDCPMGFSLWRDQTHNVLVSICSPEEPYKVDKPEENLREYRGLSRYYKDHGQRLAWCSSTKSFYRSHYNEHPLQFSDDTLCLDNALNYALFDNSKLKWCEVLHGNVNIRKDCAFQVQNSEGASTYKGLQYAVDGYSHKSNEVISNQHFCPNDLSLHEYNAFCTLRAGYRLQWLNIAREIRARILAFNDEAVYSLFMQAAWQAGPRDQASVYRQSHTDLERFEFGKTLLGELESMLTSIEANWLESTSAKILINLTTRLLSTNTHSDIAQRCFSLLSRARKVVLDWTRQLVKKLQECDIEASMKDLQLRVLQMAAICRSTYDVDNREDHLKRVLNSAEDVATLIECATYVHDNTPVNGNISAAVKNLLDRDRRLSHKIEQYIRKCPSEKTLTEGLDQTLKHIYSSYSRSSPWRSYPKPRDRWWYTDSKGLRGRNQELHYNLLNGLLLIDGSPIGRMPLNYISHPTYQQLLSGKILDVFPSSMDGMRYQIKHLISDPESEDPKSARLDYEVHFTVHRDDLIIRARVPDSNKIYEFVPRTKIIGDFPEQFVEGYVHWMDIDTGDIEFRPMSHPWTTSTENWHMAYSSTKHIYINLGQERMLDIRSPTARMIESVLGPLETAARMDMSFRPKEEKSSLSIRLPRLKLEFFMNGDNALESRQFRGAIIDPNQNIGTLSGLVNRLVLRHGTVRNVIIPYGEVDLHNHGNHVRVMILTQDLPRVQYYSYIVDSRLGRLVSNTSLASHLYKTYLHGVTSHCLPDPLTRRTGTEEALDQLRSAATFSFQRLKPEEIKILRDIASLTPNRNYYPSHLQVMQTVKWKPVAPTIQHDAYHQVVMDVFAHATRFHVLRERDEPKVEPYYQEKSDTRLLNRAAIRNSTYRKEEFGGSALESAKDIFYSARDSTFDQLDKARVHYISRAVESWLPNLDTSSQILEILEEWGHIGGSTTDNKFRLGYDHRWTSQDTAVKGIGGLWGPIYSACCKAQKENNTYQLMFFLSTLAYSGIEPQVLGTLLAFATNPKFETLTAPCHPSYDLAMGYTPLESELLGQISENFQVPFSSSDEAYWTARQGESESELRKRQYTSYEKDLSSESSGFVKQLMSQWPCACPSPPSNSYRLLKKSDIMVKTKSMFASWYRNKEFREHISNVQEVLRFSKPIKPSINNYKFQPCRVHVDRTAGVVLFETLLSRNAPDIPTFFRIPRSVIPVQSKPEHTTAFRADDTGRLNKLLDLFRTLKHTIAFRADNTGRLNRLLDLFRTLKYTIAFRADNTGRLNRLLDNFKATHSGKFEKQYADNMLESLRALEDCNTTAEMESFHRECEKTETESFYRECENDMVLIFNLIRKALAPLGEAECLMDMTGLWPCISPISLLQKLPTNTPLALGGRWKRILVFYGKSITRVQKSERLLACVENETEFDNEAINQGHEEWNPQEYPDWLLLEIESNILVRAVQTRIAYEMISPTTGKNQVLQLNMGEGKSSVIVPMISAALADGGKLVRVIVLKPLSAQMFRLLVQKLSGLTNRRIFSMPFSRAIDLDRTKAEAIQKLYEACLKEKGILLVQPEHILSFKLGGLEKLAMGDNELASILLDTQHWLELNSRDILDESDEILSHENELIYTIGAQRSLENSPDRWVIVQAIFDLIKRHAVVVNKKVRHGIEVEKEPLGMKSEAGKMLEPLGVFPTTRILTSEAGKMLLDSVALDVIEGGIPAVSFRGFGEHMRRLAYKFITDKEVDRTHIEPLLEYFKKDNASKASLLLLRGLIAENIVFFALKEKRWRVNYGLAPKRNPKTLLAVPYRAKDVPAPRAEFSHPDVAITLTCLSYYYGGLTDNELRDCFKLLLRLSKLAAADKYEMWINDFKDEVSETLHNLSGINLQDDKEFKDTIFPLFYRNKRVIDFYLSSVVFPKHAKEFPSKLSSSGWDIGAEKKHPTTGFSGTNDNRDILPLSVSQYNRPEQLNTNAKVLNFLLQPENDYICAKNDEERMNTDNLLGMLVTQEPPIQVLLDVGAQILELGNQKVAEHWLRISKASGAGWQAVIFFNENDELTVFSEGAIEAFELSTFSKQMDRCLVYLDEVHTRGTDLKLPIKSRAAVTLGPKLTKDRLVQACMRMRKLGQGQSVLFCAPPEIHRKIQNITQNPDVSAVLYWCMHETCTSNRHNIPIWAKQGFSFHRRDLAYSEARSAEVFPESLREQEAKSLEERFGLEGICDKDLSGPIPVELEERREEVLSIRGRCAQFEVDSFRGAHAQEEQERELSYEVERVQQVKRPEKKEPLNHIIHEDVRGFVGTGIIAKRGGGFEPAFRSILKTSAADQLLDSDAWSSKLFVTKDFAATVKIGSDFMDNFLRPVCWVVSADRGNELVIMSPYEVNALLPEIRRSTLVHLHIYSPKVTKGMVSFLEDLSSWTIPSVQRLPIPESLIDELNIFAGQIYLKDYSTYKRLCGFLGLSSTELSTSSSGVMSDGFVEPPYRTHLGMQVESPFSRSPVPFLRELIALRRKDQDFFASHLGQIVHGRLLSEEDFKVNV